MIEQDIYSTQIGNQVHNIGLYANDIIQGITKPCTFLPHVQNALKDFGNVFYYLQMYKFKYIYTLTDIKK